MLKIRQMEDSDKEEINRLYDEYFSNNEYPDFLDKNKFRGPFVVIDENNKIILAGGIKAIAEAVVVTDQSKSVGVRQIALLQAMGSVVHVANDIGYEQVHAFVSDDEQYVKHLQKYGFKLIDAKLLVLDVGESHG